MSKLVLICHRSVQQRPDMGRAIGILSTRLTPDNIEAGPPVVIQEEGIVLAVVNPVDSLLIRGGSVCLGMLFGRKDDWWKTGTEAPDGSYALFRCDATRIELLTDMLATRTIWYVATDDLFIASTSQRAIVYFLQSYEPNENVYPWMLSSGTLGPGYSWDRRIQSLDGDTRLTLDRASWKLELGTNPVVFTIEKRSEKEHEQRLQNAIDETFEHLNLDLSRWVLPLSGGMDSRAILQRIKGRHDLTAITWGTKSAQTDRLSDAYVAKVLAEQYGIAHEYFATDIPDEPIERIFDRFIVAGEGRIDHISGYMDGFAVWRHLYTSGVNGVLRGDQVFGWRPVASHSDARSAIGMTCLSDFRNLPKAVVRDLSQQHIPEVLCITGEETLEMYRDRLQQVFRVPVILAALNYLKCSYVEIVNPLLSRTIVRQVRTMPDALRTGKWLFRKIVSSEMPNIPFAETSAIDSYANILTNRGLVNMIVDVVSSANSARLLPPGLVTFLVTNMKKVQSSSRSGKKTGRRIRSYAKNRLPSGAADFAKFFATGIYKKPRSLNIDLNRLAFRAYLIDKTDRLFREDAQALQKDQVGTTSNSKP